MVAGGGVIEGGRDPVNVSIFVTQVLSLPLSPRLYYTAVKKLAHKITTCAAFSSPAEGSGRGRKATASGIPVRNNSIEQKSSGGGGRKLVLPPTTILPAAAAGY
jgi:hypothetical protein